MKFLKVRAALSTIGTGIKDNVVEAKDNLKSTYAVKVDTLTAQAQVNKTQAEIDNAAKKQAELSQKVKDARKAARDAARELKELATAAVDTITSDAPPAPNTAESNVVEL